MDEHVERSLARFFAAQRELARAGVIRSRDYVGDIAKYLCQAIYGLVPAKRGQPYDGTIDQARVRVVTNNCPTGHPVSVEGVRECDQVILVLGPNCWMHPARDESTILFYRWQKRKALELFQTKGGQILIGRNLPASEFEHLLRLPR